MTKKMVKNILSANVLCLKKKKKRTYSLSNAADFRIPVGASKSSAQSPRNCTKEETNGLSFASVECLWIEAKNPHFKKKSKLNIVEKIGKIILAWVLVYLVIALPLWCQYGWCCCCCRCKFCNPRERIEEIKTFYVRNPVGILQDEKGKVLKYQPTSYEKYTQKKLGKAIDRL